MERNITRPPAFQKIQRSFPLKRGEYLPLNVRGRTCLCCRLGAGGGEGRILLELAVCDSGRLCSCFQDFLCHRYQALRLFNFVIGDLNLDGDLLLRLGETGFRLRIALCAIRRSVRCGVRRQKGRR